MGKKFKYDVIHRWDGNPMITIDDIPFPCNTVFNAGCAKYNGRYILLLRLEDDGQELKIYYGASDTSICVGTANVNELIQFCTITEH